MAHDGELSLYFTVFLNVKQPPLVGQPYMGVRGDGSVLCMCVWVHGCLSVCMSQMHTTTATKLLPSLLKIMIINSYNNISSTTTNSNNNDNRNIYSKEILY